MDSSQEQNDQFLFSPLKYPYIQSFINVYSFKATGMSNHVPGTQNTNHLGQSVCVGKKGLLGPSCIWTPWLQHGKAPKHQDFTMPVSILSGVWFGFLNLWQSKKSFMIWMLSFRAKEKVKKNLKYLHLAFFFCFTVVLFFSEFVLTRTRIVRTRLTLLLLLRPFWYIQQPAEILGMQIKGRNNNLNGLWYK